MHALGMVMPERVAQKLNAHRQFARVHLELREDLQKRLDLVGVAQGQRAERCAEPIAGPVRIEVQAPGDNTVGVVKGPEIANRDVIGAVDHLAGGDRRSLHHGAQSGGDGARTAGPRKVAAPSSTHQTTSPASGRTPTAGQVTGSHGPTSTRCTEPALPLPATRKNTAAAGLMTGNVIVSRPGGSAGAW